MLDGYLWRKTHRERERYSRLLCRWAPTARLMRCTAPTWLIGRTGTSELRWDVGCSWNHARNRRATLLVPPLRETRWLTSWGCPAILPRYAQAACHGRPSSARCWIVMAWLHDSWQGWQVRADGGSTILRPDQLGARIGSLDARGSMGAVSR